ncbi:MAG TPA: hypothetical protein VKB38_16740 [Terracidiphilus sp.]|nr:hypothetical protein [Terracidiphilus sp.]
MASTAAAAPANDARNFAALLAEMAAPKKKFPPVRDLNGLDQNGLDGLADDVATLTYESSLRTQTRYPPNSSTDASPDASSIPEDSPERIRSAAPLIFEAFAPEPAKRAETPLTAAHAAREKFRCASVTVRLSPQENEQLRQRAAEAGMTVSAYLRSCTFEVESLRAQVKATLDELRKAQAAVTGPGERKDVWWLRWRPRIRETTVRVS